jgi:hypothetical protein
MTAYESSSFSAGQDSGTRVAACVARLAALELMDESHWWNRRRHRHMASALVACAEELEDYADASAAAGPAEVEGEAADCAGPLPAGASSPTSRGAAAPV